VRLLAVVLVLLVSLALGLPFFEACHAQDSGIQPGASIQLVTRDNGIPGHPAAGNNSVSFRFPSGSEAVVTGVDPGFKNWLKIKAGNQEHWIITKYVAEVISGDSVHPGPESTSSITIGAWNLEHFSNSATRGFPEDTYSPKGPTYPKRTQQQMKLIADVIANKLSASLLMLCEIDADLTMIDEETLPVSEELDSLLQELPAPWKSTLSRSGNEMHIALIYDSSRIRVNQINELEVPSTIVQGKDIFERDPLAVHVTLLESGQPGNDLVVVGVHLASGQDKNQNHDEAMARLLSELEEAQIAGRLGGTAEDDILILGDMNANMFSPPAERFFLDMDEADGLFDVLADSDYPATRLSGVPLKQRTSQIDYIIASRFISGSAGLSGQEITQESATVHDELLQTWPPDDFRKNLSDHLPVTVSIRLQSDND